MRKVKIFTHTDLDGVGSPIVFKALYLNSNGLSLNDCDFDITYSETGKEGTIDMDVSDFLEESKIAVAIDEFDFDYIAIMDLTPTSELLLKDLVDFCNTNKVAYGLFDHHRGLEWASQISSDHYIYPTNNRNILNSATSVIKDFFMFNSDGLMCMYPNVLSFSEMVRSYDTWDWSNNPSDLFGSVAKDWNNLLYLLGRDKFIEEVERIVFSQDVIQFNNIPEHLQAFVDMDARMEKEYIERKLESAEFNSAFIDGKVLYYASVFGEQYHSTLGNSMCKYLKHPQTQELIDFAVVRNGHKLSLRTVKDDVKVNEICSTYFDGGGHFKAAGGKQEVPELKFYS